MFRFAWDGAVNSTAAGHHEEHVGMKASGFKLVYNWFWILNPVALART
jgi:hypothetical protein